MGIGMVSRLVRVVLRMVRSRGEQVGNPVILDNRK